MAMSPEAIANIFSLLIGFALAAALAYGYQALAKRPLGFSMLQDEAFTRALMAVPFLVFAAPFILLRNTVRENPDAPRRFQVVMMTTILAGFWSTMSGIVVVTTLGALGLLV